MKAWAESTFDKIARKYAAQIPNAAQAGILPYRGVRDKWLPSPSERNSWWTGGFWPALMWQLYAATKDGAFAGEARRTQALLKEELAVHHGLHHDVGFMYLLSFGAEWRITGDETQAAVVHHAANLLAGRYNPAGFIRAWNGKGREGWSIIDTMMNLPLLYWATEYTEDPRYAAMADRHIEMATRNFIRPDGSSEHIVVMDARTGEVVETRGGQGYENGSSWTRGQAWALHGFTLAHRNTGNADYLNTAKRIAHYFIANIRPDGLIDCDFRQPRNEERFDNIAGACAASGLLMLADAVPPLEAPLYRDAAVKMLRAMDELCADYTLDTFGVLQKCTAAYHDDGNGRHVNIVYGDYFFLEALARILGTDPGLWDARKA